MATVLITLRQQLAGKVCTNTFHFNNLTVGAGAPAVPAQLAAAFVANILPKIVALQSDEVLTLDVNARDLGAPATQATVSSALTGTVVATPESTLQPSYVANIRRTASSWINVNTGLAYIGTRPGQSGRLFLSGLDESWQNDSGGAVPVALGTEWAALVTALTGTLATTTPAATWNHVVFSPGKGALGGLPARDPLIADVTGITLRELTRLSTRRF